jgi:gluconolactonase
MTLEHLVGPHPNVERVVTGFRFTEGPVFSHSGFLLFSDVKANRIIKWHGNSTEAYRDNSNGANGLTFDHEGRLLACEETRVSRTERDGSIIDLASTFESKDLASPNDVVCARDGTIYFSVMSRVIGAGNHAHSNPAPPAIYQITPEGRLRIGFAGGSRPNGIALSANQKLLFAADIGEDKIRVFERTDEGSLKNGRVFCELKSKTSGGPDGLKTDDSGNLWVAGPGGIWVFDAAGKHVGTVPVPETPSNCAWGDDLRTLYVTARTSVYRITTRVNGTRIY